MDDQDEYAVLVDNLRALTGMHGVSQKEFGEFVGISKQGIWQMSTGRLRPSLNSARKIAAAFGITTDELFLPTDQVVMRAAAVYSDAPIRELAEARRYGKAV